MRDQLHTPLERSHHSSTLPFLFLVAYKLPNESCPSSLTFHLQILSSMQECLSEQCIVRSPLRFSFRAPPSTTSHHLPSKSSPLRFLFLASFLEGCCPGNKLETYSCRLFCRYSPLDGFCTIPPRLGISFVKRRFGKNLQHSMLNVNNLCI